MKAKDKRKNEMSTMKKKKKGLWVSGWFFGFSLLELLMNKSSVSWCTSQLLILVMPHRGRFSNTIVVDTLWKDCSVE